MDLPVTPGETATLIWLRLAVTPVGDTVAERVTVPAN